AMSLATSSSRARENRTGPRTRTSMKLTIAIAAAALFMSDAALARTPADKTACEREMQRAAAKHGIPLGMLYAVGLTESGRGDSLRPYALNIDGQAVYDIGRAEAVKLFN